MFKVMFQNLESRVAFIIAYIWSKARDKQLMTKQSDKTVHSKIT